MPEALYSLSHSVLTVTHNRRRHHHARMAFGETDSQEGASFKWQHLGLNLGTPQLRAQVLCYITAALPTEKLATLE